MIAMCMKKSAPAYVAYRKGGVLVEENDLYQTISFFESGREYLVYRSRRSATKATHIECGKSGTVYWKQLHAIGHISVAPEINALIHPPRDTGKTVIVLIKGKPAVITGLDENGFVSSRGTPKSPTDVFVMSEAAFRRFALHS